MALPNRGQATALVAAASREWAETRAMMEYARSSPRSEDAAREMIAKSCARPAFADAVEWEYQRGKKKNEQTGQWEDNILRGPSVYLMREIARCWEHVSLDVRVLEDDGESIHGESVAHDLQRNTRSRKQWKVRKLIQRKVWGADKKPIRDPETGKDKTQWIVPDERDLLELVNKTASKALRNAIIEVIPDDVVQEARQLADVTLDKLAKGLIDQHGKPTEKGHAADGKCSAIAIDRLVGEFRRVGASIETLEKHVGHSIDELTPEEWKALTRIGAAIKQGAVTVKDAFAPEPSAEEASVAAATAAEVVREDDDPFETGGKGAPETLDEVVAAKRGKKNGSAKPEPEKPDGQ